jgi:uncharacterized membrane protein (DUF441 family)
VKMNFPNLLMILVLILGIIGGSHIISVAAGILILLQLVRMDTFFPLLEDWGIEIGLTFLVMAVLVPFVSGNVSNSQAFRTCFSLPGLIAILSGILATKLNCKGLEILQATPSIMIGIVLGSIVGVVFFRGIPVGPLMAAGIAALLLKIFNLSP